MVYIAVILLIGFLALAHELGHYLAAKCVKIPVDIFSIGFGPKLWSYKKRETEYRVSAIPVGGYVLPGVKDEKEFFRFPVLSRIILSIGGILANLVLSLFLYALLNTITGGFSLSGIFIKPFIQTFSFMSRIFCAIPGLFTDSGQMSGAVGIIAIGSKFMGAGIVKALNFAILLNINFAVFNLFPIPALDGGKIILYIMEMIYPKSIKLHIPFAVAGWVLIITLTVYTTVLDIGKYFL